MQLISKHLSEKKIKPQPVEGIEAICAFTGKKITRGFLKSEVIKKTFTDHEWIKYNSDYISPEITLLIENFDGKKSLRNFSFYACEKELKFLKREETLHFLFNIPEIPFRIGITYGGKKHIAYKSFLSYNRENFKIITDKGVVNFEKKKAKEILKVAQKWYTVIPEKKETKAQPTFFTKDDIKGISQPPYKKIQRYGIKEYFQEKKHLDQFCKTPLLELITYILNKEI